jgi:hypothetical protein
MLCKADCIHGEFTARILALKYFEMQCLVWSAEKRIIVLWFCFRFSGYNYDKLHSISTTIYVIVIAAHVT